MANVLDHVQLHDNEDGAGGKGTDFRPPIAEKVGRDAFLYMEPLDGHGERDFAQCGPCRMFVPQKAVAGWSPSSLCILHGSHVSIDEDDSCGFMAPWPTGEPNPKVIADHAAELKKDIPGSVTPHDSGLVSRQVRCENCGFFKPVTVKCGLYEFLDRVAPHVFDLGKYVQKAACCNANTQLSGKSKDDA